MDKSMTGVPLAPAKILGSIVRGKHFPVHLIQQKALHVEKNILVVIMARTTPGATLTAATTGNTAAHALVGNTELVAISVQRVRKQHHVAALSMIEQ